MITISPITMASIQDAAAAHKAARVRSQKVLLIVIGIVFVAMLTRR